jgi:hypothetical protein
MVLVYTKSDLSLIFFTLYIWVLFYLEKKKKKKGPGWLNELGSRIT